MLLTGCLIYSRPLPVTYERAEHSLQVPVVIGEDGRKHLTLDMNVAFTCVINVGLMVVSSTCIDSIV